MLGKALALSYVISLCCLSAGALPPVSPMRLVDCMARVTDPDFSLHYCKNVFCAFALHTVVSGPITGRIDCPTTAAAGKFAEICAAAHHRGAIGWSSPALGMYVQ